MGKNNHSTIKDGLKVLNLKLIDSTEIYRPFTPILVVDYNKIVFFSQTLAKLCRFHPSTVIPTSLSAILKMLPYFRIININPLKIFLGQQNKPPFMEIPAWGTEIIHELRTSVLHLDLGINAVLKDTEATRKIVQANRRIKISTLLASDFIQLHSTPPEIELISLDKVIQDILTIVDNGNVKYSIIRQNTPDIWANQTFLSSFFINIITWLNTYSLIIEFELLNLVSIKIRIITPDDYMIALLPGYRMVTYYIDYIASYFNARAWFDQNSLNIIFPSLSHLYKKLT